MSSLATNLISYYKLDNTADSVGSNTLTNNGTVTFPTGFIGNCADLGTANSTKYLSATTNYGITGGSNFSVSIWVKLNTEITTGSYTFFSVIDNTDAVQHYVGYEYNGGTIRALYDRITLGVLNNRIYANGALGTTGYHHFVATYNGSIISFYKDGILAATLSTSGNGSNHLATAAQIGDTTTNAKFDEVGVWSRALSADEVSQLFNSGRGNAYPLTDTPSLYGCTSYYKLDSSNSNDNINSINGTDTSITYSTGNGKIGIGAGFNGSSGYISIPTAVVDASKSYTVSMWVKINSYPTAVGCPIFEKFNNDTGWNYGTPSIGFGTTGTLHFDNRDSSGFVSGLGFGSAFTTGTWYHITAVYDSSISTYGTYYTYLNGVIVSSTTGSRAPTNYSNPVRIGRSADSYQTDYFNGALDEIGVWSRALTSTEISSLNGGGAGNQWPFNSVVSRTRSPSGGAAYSSPMMY